jgi:hypothetical protein
LNSFSSQNGTNRHNTALAYFFIAGLVSPSVSNMLPPLNSEEFGKSRKLTSGVTIFKFIYALKMMKGMIF